MGEGSHVQSGVGGWSIQPKPDDLEHVVPPQSVGSSVGGGSKVTAVAMTYLYFSESCISSVIPNAESLVC